MIYVQGKGMIIVMLIKKQGKTRKGAMHDVHEKYADVCQEAAQGNGGKEWSSRLDSKQEVDFIL